MKNFITLAIIATIITSHTTAFAGSIPRESVPMNATEEQIKITENIIGDILDEIVNGVGYNVASARANTKIRKAVNANQTNDYGYGILSAISQNAIRTTRDMYLRADYYKSLEEKLSVLLVDLITEVQNGKDYYSSYEEAKTMIYQSVKPNYNPSIDKIGDFCYWNIPSVDSAEFTVARKLLLEAIQK